MSRKGAQVEKATRQVITSSKVDLGQCSNLSPRQVSGVLRACSELRVSSASWFTS